MKTFNEVYKDSGLGKWFHKQSAGGEPGWDRYDSTGKKAGKCGDSKDGEPYAACLSKQKAQKLGKKGVSSFVKRKRRAQSSAGKPDKGDGGKGAKPVNVKTGVTDKDPKKKGIQEMKSFRELTVELQEKNEPTNPKLWSSVLSQARSKFDVYPSAYANAWASKQYKSKGGGWKSKKEEVECGCEACSEENIIEKMDPTDHVSKKGGKFAVVNVNGKTVKTFDDEKEADAYAIKFHDKLMNKIEEKSAAWQRKAGKNKEGGLNAAGRKSYERENPGSDLKAPVSAAQAKKSGKGGKAANRRKSFCARMGGMPGPMKDEKGRPTRKALALRKWDC